MKKKKEEEEIDVLVKLDEDEIEEDEDFDEFINNLIEWIQGNSENIDELIEMVTENGEGIVQAHFRLHAVGQELESILGKLSQLEMRMNKLEEKNVIKEEE